MGVDVEDKIQKALEHAKKSQYRMTDIQMEFLHELTPDQKMEIMVEYPEIGEYLNSIRSALHHLKKLEEKDLGKLKELLG